MDTNNSPPDSLYNQMRQRFEELSGQRLVEDSEIDNRLKDLALELSMIQLECNFLERIVKGVDLEYEDMKEDSHGRSSTVN